MFITLFFNLLMIMLFCKDFCSKQNVSFYWYLPHENLSVTLLPLPTTNTKMKVIDKDI